MANPDTQIVQAVTQQAVAQLAQHPPQDYAINLPEVGMLTGMVLAAVVGFGYVLSKFKKDTTANAIEGNLYKNLSDRIESITKTLERVESEREQLFVKVTKAESRITELEKHEIENKLLRTKLNEKDDMIDDLQASLVKKQLEIDELNTRVHNLEMQIAVNIKDCDICDYKRVVDEMDLNPDTETPLIPIESSK